MASSGTPSARRRRAACLRPFLPRPVHRSRRFPSAPGQAPIEQTLRLVLNGRLPLADACRRVAKPVTVRVLTSTHVNSLLELTQVRRFVVQVVRAAVPDDRALCPFAPTPYVTPIRPVGETLYRPTLFPAEPWWAFVWPEELPAATVLA